MIDAAVRQSLTWPLYSSEPPLLVGLCPCPCSVRVLLTQIAFMHGEEHAVLSGYASAAWCSALRQGIGLTRAGRTRLISGARGSPEGGAALLQLLVCGCNLQSNCQRVHVLVISTLGCTPGITLIDSLRDTASTALAGTNHTCTPDARMLPAQCFHPCIPNSNKVGTCQSKHGTTQFLSPAGRLL